MNPVRLPAALMSRLSYARKFALLGLVLLAPAAFALHAYWGVQGETLAFASFERVGVRYLAPANELVLRVVAARGLAVRAAAGDESARAELAGAERAVRSAVAGVDRVDAADGAAINMRENWQAARATILAAHDRKTAPPARGWTRCWSRAWTRCRPPATASPRSCWPAPSSRSSSSSGSSSPRAAGSRRSPSGSRACATTVPPTSRPRSTRWRGAT